MMGKAKWTVAAVAVSVVLLGCMDMAATRGNLVEIVVRQYSLTVVDSQGGSVSVRPEKEKYLDGDQVTITAMANSGWYFGGWQGDIDGIPQEQSSITITMDRSRRISPLFIQRQWTIAVYMAADNDLEAAAIQDLNEMEAAVGEGMTVVALLDRGGGYDGTNGDWTTSRLYQVERDEGGLNGTIISRRLECPRLDLYLDQETELDMGDPWVLEGFLEYAQTTYPAQHTVLVVWGHGTGWRSAVGTTSTYSGGTSGGGRATVGTSRAVAIDDSSGSYMRTSQLASAVTGRGLSAIVFDTCFGSTVEVAYQLAPHTQLLAGAAGLAPSAGLDYRRVLEALAGGITLDSLIQGLTADNGGREPGARMSVVDTARVQELRDSLEDFAAALAATITSRGERDRVLDILLQDTTGYHHGSYPCDLFLDVADMAERFTGHGTATVAAGAKRLKAAVAGAVSTPEAAAGQVGLYLIPLAGRSTTATSHSQEYVRGSGVTGQGRFVAESYGWAPTDGGAGGSLLDRLFYTTYGN